MRGAWLRLRNLCWKGCGRTGELVAAKNAAFLENRSANPNRAKTGDAHRTGSSIDAATTGEMKYVKYKRYTGEEAGDVDLQELMNRLADFFLQSGFETQYQDITEFDPEQTMEQLRQAILAALEQGNLVPSQTLDELMRNPDLSSNQRLRKLIDELIERLAQEGMIAPQQGHVTGPPKNTPGGRISGDEREAHARFEITDKALDFLGFKTLKDLLASLGKSSFGRHDTRDLATGIESGGNSKPYEFGDTLNLDVSETLFRAVRRNGPGVPIEVDYPDLMVHQCEYQSSCATVVMLDCSHSMILYGEDRFTPAKRVALALSHLIRTQYPGDSLHCVLFHDSAEEIPIGQLARVQVGPHYTNTREGLRLAQRILNRQKKDMRQIVMITDGKPSALTLDDGRIYKNAFGLDPLVVNETLEEVSKCRRSGILINTFMLASDYSLVHFVQKVTEICRGKAYFTTPYTLGQYLLLDYVQKKSRHIH
jgi:Ca-activated chloride channel homolog